MRVLFFNSVEALHFFFFVFLLYLFAACYYCIRRESECGHSLDIAGNSSQRRDGTRKVADISFLDIFPSAFRRPAVSAFRSVRYRCLAHPRFTSTVLKSCWNLFSLSHSFRTTFLFFLSRQLTLPFSFVLFFRRTSSGQAGLIGTFLAICSRLLRSTARFYTGTLWR